MNATNRYFTQRVPAMPLILYLTSKNPSTLNAAGTLNDGVILILGVGLLHANNGAVSTREGAPAATFVEFRIVFALYIKEEKENIQQRNPVNVH